MLTAIHRRFGLTLTPSGTLRHFCSRISLCLSAPPAPRSSRCRVTVWPSLLQIRTSHASSAIRVAITEPGASRKLVRSAGHCAIGITSWDGTPVFPGGNVNRATSRPRLVTSRVSSSMNSTPCGHCRAGEDSSTPPISATRGAPADAAMSMSKTTTRFRWKEATARRRLPGEKRTSSVRPRRPSASVTLGGAT